MKRTMAVITSVSLLFSAVPMVSAKGIFITPGTRANALGGAYVAIADDPTAVYWNPAGLAHLKGRDIELSMTTIMGPLTSNTSLKNAPVPNQNDGDFPLPKIYDATATGGLTPTTEPAFFQKKQCDTVALLPFLGAYAEHAGYTFALAYYGIAGGGGTWKDTVSDIASLGDTLHASVDAQYYMMVYNISAATQIDQKWSIGVGVDMLSMVDKMKATKTYDKGIASPMDSYALASEKNATGTGVQVNAGVLFKPTAQWSTGFAYRSGTTIALSGKNTFSAGGFAGLAAFGLSDFETTYDQKYTYPTTYSCGAAYDPTPRWTVAAAITQNNYSASRLDVSYATQNGALGLVNTNLSQNYKDTTQLHIGSEYRYTDQWAFRAGLFTDPVQVPTDQLTLINISEVNAYYLVLGAGYKHKIFSFDIGYARGFSDKPSKDSRDYEYTIDSVRVAANYLF